MPKDVYTLVDKETRISRQNIAGVSISLVLHQKNNLRHRDRLCFSKIKLTRFSSLARTKARLENHTIFKGKWGFCRTVGNY